MQLMGSMEKPNSPQGCLLSFVTQCCHLPFWAWGVQAVAHGLASAPTAPKSNQGLVSHCAACFRAL
eukprot:6373416-Amphidinium_carterae.2